MSHKARSVLTILALIAITIPLSPATRGAGKDWPTCLESLARTTEPAVQDQMIRCIQETGATTGELAQAIRELPYPEPPVLGDLWEEKRLCTDGMERPYLLYIPSGYRSDRPAPLLLYLHGGVSRDEIIERRQEYARENPFLTLAEEQGWLLLFPFGQQGATWWDPVGIENVLGTIRAVKREFHVDDDRVFMTGFSDGGSASYLFAMMYPSDFGAFLPLNGHMGVGSLDGGLHCYPGNMGQTPIYSVNTEEDGLYPVSKMEPMVAFAQQAGGDLLYRTFPEIGHRFDYAEVEIPRMARFMERHPRDPFPVHINWEAAHASSGRCHWLSIERITAGALEPWHQDANFVGVDDSIVFGFLHDDQYRDEGMRVGGLVGGDTLCSRVGIKPGDILVRCGAEKVRDVHDLNRIKESLQRGDPVNLTILREGKKLKLTGTLPESVPYFLFPRQRPSARIRATVRANRVEIESSRLGRVNILIHPDLFQLDQPITVTAGGRQIFQGLVEPDPEFLLRNWLDNRDRKLLYQAQLTLDIPSNPSL